MPQLPIKDLSPCCITFGYGASGALELKPFLGPVTLRGEDSVSKVFEEEFGDAAVDGVFAGTVMELDVPMTRSTWAQLAAVFPGATLVGTELRIANKCGSDMYANSVQLLIRPIEDNVCSPNHSEWTMIYHAHPFCKWELPWDRATQRFYMFGFMIFPSMTSGQIGRFLKFGVT